MDRIEQSIDELSQEVKYLLSKIDKSHMDKKSIEDRLQSIGQEITHKNKNYLETWAQKGTEIEQRLDKLDGMVLSGETGIHQGRVEKSLEYRDFVEVIKKGFYNVDTKSMNVNFDPQGFLRVPQVLESLIEKELLEMSPMRQIASVSTMSAGVNKLDQLVREKVTGSSRGTRVLESVSSKKITPKYKKVSFSLSKQKAETIVTEEMVTFGAFNIRGEITSNAIDQFSRDEQLDFLYGDGNNAPMGILKNTDVQDVNMSSNKLNFDDMMRLWSTFEKGYSHSSTAVMIMSKPTFSQLLQLKDGNGNFIYRNGIDNFFIGAPNKMVLGVPIMIFDDMKSPDNKGAYTSKHIPIVYGDFKRGYKIYDGEVGTQVLMDQYSLSSDGEIKYIWTRYNDGRVLIPDAFKRLVAP